MNDQTITYPGQAAPPPLITNESATSVPVTDFAQPPPSSSAQPFFSQNMSPSSKGPLRLILVMLIVVALLAVGFFVLEQHHNSLQANSTNNLQQAVEKLQKSAKTKASTTTKNQTATLPQDAKFNSVTTNTETVNSSLTVSGQTNTDELSSGAITASSLSASGNITGANINGTDLSVSALQGDTATLGTLKVGDNATISGSIAAGGPITIDNNQVCSSSGCIISPGSNYYIQNGTAAETANLHIKSASSSNAAAVIGGASNQTADLLELQNASGSTLAKVDSNGNLSVQSATINGSLSINGHIITSNSSGATSITVGSAADNGTASINGDDTLGTVTITTGSNPFSSGTIATVGFANSFGSSPKAVISPVNSSSANALPYVGTESASSFQIDVSAIPSPNTVYVFNYFVGN